MRRIISTVLLAVSISSVQLPTIPLPFQFSLANVMAHVVEAGNSIR